MQAIDLDINLDEINHGPDVSPRSEGLHLSQIIRDIENTVTKTGQRPAWSTLSEEDQRRGKTYQAGGFAWERALERSLCSAFERGAVVRPGEQFMDGIFGTPDLLDIEHGVLEEWKCTWRSSRKFDDLEGNFRPWMWQIKSYLKLLGLNVCNLRVLFINGDYRDSGPQVKGKTLIFSDIEIDDNWAMIVNHARHKGWL